MNDDSSPSDIEEDSVNTGSTTNLRGDEGKQMTDAGKANLADKESNAVRKLRYLVFLALFLAALVVSVIVYVITSSSQQREFEIQYVGMANELVKTFEDIATQKLSVLGSLRVSMMSHVLDMEKSSPITSGLVSVAWPFVTFPSFQQRAASVRKLSKSLYIGLYPVVNENERSQWESYSAINKKIWLEESLKYQERSNYTVFGASNVNLDDSMTSIPISMFGNLSQPHPGPGPYLPIWQTSPLVNQVLNQNMLNVPFLPDVTVCFEEGKVVFGSFLLGPPGNSTSENVLTQYFAGYLSTAEQNSVNYAGDPFSNIQFPIYGSFDKEDTKPVAMISAMVHWGSYLKNILPSQAKGMVAVLENPCSGAFTYLLYGGSVVYVGQGDFHDTKFDKYLHRASFDEINKIDDGSEYGVEFINSYCPVSLVVYPSQEYSDAFNTNLPIMMTLTVFFVFVFAVAMFLVYDRLVERRQRLVLAKALQSSAIVLSLFPGKVAEQMMMQQSAIGKGTNTHFSSKHRLKTMLNNEDKMLDGHSNAPLFYKEQPIAELFPHTTVLFADIAGFTAWSSTREPTQVFTLLQGVYQAFDIIAKRRKVFKVETIGDSYLAVTGLPEPQEQHAVIMARFAVECQKKMVEVTNRLELHLGPGTSELTMRTGLHSGPVTGGVLVGDKARFQLFGDTVNTAARMESTGASQKIQISSSTASLLVDAGKSHWIIPREDQVNAKGKGILQTFWLNIHSNSTLSKALSESDGSRDDVESFANDFQTGVVTNIVLPSTDQNAKMIDWICEILQKQIKNVISARESTRKQVKSSSLLIPKIDTASVPIDEIVEAIILPEFSKSKSGANQCADQSILNENVISQLHQLISILAQSYHNNPFHNFEHACHVTMSVNKLLMRVVSPDLDLDNVESSQIASHLHDYTNGINSDPITQFAIIFSAIIHDIDHRGVSNNQLSKEQPVMASKYKNKSIAEQNSFDIAWKVLMSDSFDELRNSIFETKEEMLRFRQVVVNAVMATDIMDKDLNDLRKKRWGKAFSDYRSVRGKETRNLQATIVIEHMMQASDVAHTMQHWHVYRKWNAKLYKEMYEAYRSGRLKSNPSEFWYEGELGFFDNYIIPLAKKLKDCNVFGVSSDEYLNYAEKNRAEWEAMGREVVVAMAAEMAANEIEDNNEPTLSSI